jgi:hypothetical protein
MNRKEMEKYFVYDTPINPFHPPGTFAGIELFTIKDDIIIGTQVNFGAVWFTGPWEESEVYKPHWHDSPELMAWLGTDPKNPRELGAEVEFWIEDEKFMLTRTCAVYLPKGVQHNPMFPRKVDRPFLWVTTLPTEIVGMHYTTDPKWNRFKDLPNIVAPGWTHEKPPEGPAKKKSSK